MHREPTVTEGASQRSTFVVRIWREEGQPEWKGWVQHAGTGEFVSVRNLDEMLTFIERRAGRLADPARKGLK